MTLWNDEMQWHVILWLFQNRRIKLHSENRLSSREAGYIAPDQAVPMEQAKKNIPTV